MTWKHLLSTLHEWHLRVRTRRQIRALDPHTIGDLGVAASQMTFEANKPFWRK